MAPNHTQGLAQITSMLRLFHVKATAPADVCAGNDKLAAMARVRLCKKLPEITKIVGLVRATITKIYRALPKG